MAVSKAFSNSAKELCSGKQIMLKLLKKKIWLNQNGNKHMTELARLQHSFGLKFRILNCYQVWAVGKFRCVPLEAIWKIVRMYQKTFFKCGLLKKVFVNLFFRIVPILKPEKAVWGPRSRLSVAGNFRWWIASIWQVALERSKTMNYNSSRDC